MEKRKTTIIARIGIAAAVLTVVTGLWGCSGEETAVVEPIEERTEETEAEAAENASGEAKEEDGQEPPVLEDITWDDSAGGGPILHFAFSNGKVVDQKSPFQGVVENTKRRDMDGDGREEVIVYSSLKNAEAEYSMMDFYQIEGDSVKNISPAKNLTEWEEEEGCIWSMEETEAPSEEYTVMLRATAYDSMSDLMYQNMELTIGYDKEGWQIIEKRTLPEWKKAYLEYVTGWEESYPQDWWRYRLLYLDGDEIPELVCEESDAQFGVGIVACVDGKAEKVASFGGQGCSVCYQEREGNLVVSNAMMGNVTYSGYHFQDGRMEPTFVLYTSIPPWPTDGSGDAWYWNENVEEIAHEETQEITHEEFSRREDEVYAHMNTVLPYSYERSEGDGVMTLDELCDVLTSLDDRDVVTGQ